MNETMVLPEPGPADAPPADDPMARLLGELNRGRRGLAVVVRARSHAWLGAAGVTAFCLGVALILLGWSGVAHSRYLQQELAYVVSGGILGAALVVLGAAFYIGYLLVGQQRTLDRIARALEDGEGSPHS